MHSALLSCRIGGGVTCEKQRGDLRSDANRAFAFPVPLYVPLYDSSPPRLGLRPFSSRPFGIPSSKLRPIFFRQHDAFYFWQLLNAILAQPGSCTKFLAACRKKAAQEKEESLGRKFISLQEPATRDFPASCQNVSAGCRAAAKRFRRVAGIPWRSCRNLAGAGA